MEKKHLSYKLIVYGEYQEKDYLYVVQKAKYVIWVGCAESQGIALQETLACNVPILVWDVEKLGDWQPKNKSEENFFSEKERKYTKATSAPYFSQRCGIVFISEKKLNSAIETMEQKYNTFHPRSYVVKNLSLEVQAYAFLTLYEKHYSMSIESGFSEKLFDNKNWITNHVIDKGLVSIEKMLMYLRRE
ncbi:MAG: hypothetical protein COY70_04580 [Candidatus Magasanikbacteria bacterium CG_4_10_14_0_8_um_filter_42_12]|nr:MAG: hypothetical protein COY70_04580 [Candidatus Magasanikbacteria bacterium CG_4_10_14_0_8_um_filter_42_12]